MSQRRLVLVLVVLVLAAVGAALWLAMRPPEVAVDATKRAEEAVATGTAPAQPAAPKKKIARADARTKWERLGPGTVVGVLREYGSDRPLEGVELTLEAGLPGPNEILRAKTRADGGFVFEKVTNFDGWMFRAKAPAPLVDTELAGIAVIENRETDLGTVYLAPGFSVPGVVVDEKGEPVPGATVRAIRARTVSSTMDILRLVRELPSRPVAVDTATSGEDGKFALRKVPPGRYDFTVERATYQIRVEQGVVVTPDAKSHPLKFVLLRGFQLDGRVVREGPGPLAAIPVVAFHTPNDQSGFNVLDKTFATTDEKGAFHLDGLGGGRYVVAVTPEGEPAVAADEVMVPTKKPVEIVLKGDSFLEGRVTGEADTPVPDAQVYAISFDSRQPTIGNAKTDPDGRYVMRGLRSGPLQAFLVQAEGYGIYPEDVSAIMRNRGKPEITLQPGRNEKNVSLAKGGTVKGVVKEKGTDAGIAGVRVELVTPLAFFGGGRGATTGADGTFEITSVPKGAALLMASKDGWFQPGVNAQSAMMVMMQAMQRSGGSAGKDSGKGATILVSEPGEVIERTLELAHGSSLSGTVSSPDGQLVSGAQVSLVPETDGNDMMRAFGGLVGAPEPRLTDAQGRYEIPGPPPGQKARVVARATGWLDGRTDVLTCGAGDVKTGVDVKMRQGATLAGRVRDERSRPLDGALVRWVAVEDGDREDWSVQWRLRNATPTATDAKGEFRVPNVEPGKLIVQVSEPRHLSWSSSDLTAEDGRTKELDVTLKGGAAVTGRVLGVDGKPKSGATVRFDRQGPAPADHDRFQQDDGETATDAAGAFRAEGLVPGQYVLTARCEGSAPSEPVTTATDGAAVTLQLTAAFAISGTVKLRGGAPVADVEVAALRRAGQPKPGGPENENPGEQVADVRTDGAGAFELKDLPSGTYDVQVRVGWGQMPRPNVTPTTVKEVQAGRQALVIEVEPGLTITGTVTGEDGQPVGGGWVWAQREKGGGPGVGSQIEDGRFELAGLHQGRYRVSVRTGKGNYERTLMLEAGAKDVSVDFAGGASIRVRAKRSDNSAAAGAWASTHAADGSGGGGTQTDEKGECEIRALPAGTYTVEVDLRDATGHWHGKLEAVQVPRAGDRVDADVTLEKQPQ